MKLTAEYWIKYINTHTSANKAAERRMERYIAVHGIDDMDKLADYAYALVSKYGEAASALSCEMYDRMARAQRANVPEAIPAKTASYGEVASAVRGAGKRSLSLIPDAVGRLVKQAGADTTLQNAKRDKAYFAWVAHGDTCPYCMALAGLGWQRAGELTLKGGHAEHIHANCDCEYAIDLKGDLEIDGYDPYEINRQLLDMTDGEFDADSLIRMSGRNAKGRDHGALNIVRRKQYAANKVYINAQKRLNYARKTGALSGAYNDDNDPFFEKRRKIGEDLYIEIGNRKRKYEIEAVAENTDFTRKEIDIIFAHVFENEHLFEDGSVRKFDPDYYMAHSWLRLREGKNIQAHDVIMLHHELEEARIMNKNLDIPYEKAHNQVEKKWNYRKALMRYLEDHEA